MSYWACYMLRCADNSLYTGITTDMPRRLREHSGVGGSKRGAKYTRTRRPVRLVYKVDFQQQVEAAAHERFLKSLPKAEKEKWVSREAQ